MTIDDHEPTQSIIWMNAVGIIQDLPMESTAPAIADGDSAGASKRKCESAAEIKKLQSQISELNKKLGIDATTDDNSSDDEGSWDLEKHNADIIRLIKNNDPDFTYLSINEEWNEGSDDDTYILDYHSIESLGKLIGKNNQIRELSMRWLDDTYDNWSKGALKAFFE